MMQRFRSRPLITLFAMALLVLAVVVIPRVARTAAFPYFEIVDPVTGTAASVGPSAGTNGVTVFCASGCSGGGGGGGVVTQPSPAALNATVYQPTGTSLHAVVDSGAVTATLGAGSAAIGSVTVTTLPALPTGANTIGNVNQTTGASGYGFILDSAGTNVAGVDSSHNVLTKINAALPAGANGIGSVTLTGTLPAFAANPTIANTSFGSTQSTTPWVDNLTQWGSAALGGASAIGTPATGNIPTFQGNASGVPLPISCTSANCLGPYNAGYGASSVSGSYYGMEGYNGTNNNALYVNSAGTAHVAETPRKYTQISSATAVQICATACVFYGAFSNGIQTNALTCYDNTAASGTILATALLGSAGASFSGIPGAGIATTTGLDCQVPTAVVGSVNIWWGTTP